MRIRSIAIFLVGSALVFGGILMQSRTKEAASTTIEDMFSAAIADAASVDYFLKIDGIDGESKDGKHKEWIEIQSWSWSESTPGVMASGGVAAPKFSEITIKKTTDKATPKLFLATAKGNHIPRAVLTVRKVGSPRADYFIVEMEDVVISSYQTGGSSGELPTESVSLNYSRIKMTYFPQNTDGSFGDAIKAGWDVGTNQEIQEPQ